MSGAGKIHDIECVAISGGVGGAKLALGLSRVMPQENLMIVANTADDFEHLGLHVSPDLDTIMYTLGGLSNPEAGWGRSDETWNFMAALRLLGGEDWFLLGDKDLATHVERTRRLDQGEPLSEVTAHLCRQLGIGPKVIPMSDDQVRTIVHTKIGDLPFQHYFVREQCVPEVTGFSFQGIEDAAPALELMDALSDPRLTAIVICPSNPYVSVDPVLSLAGMRDALREAAAPVIAVSPIVGGVAIKGPAAKMMAELGVPAGPAAVCEHYEGLIDGFVLDRVDEAASEAIEHLGVRCLATGTVMKTLEDREKLARAVLDFARELR